MVAVSSLQVRGDLQSTDGHQGGPTGHHHLGHSDWTEKERLPLRELCTLAHIQVNGLLLFFFSLIVKISFTFSVFTCAAPAVTEFIIIERICSQVEP